MIPKGYTTVCAVVPQETRDRIAASAHAAGLSVSALLAEWVERGAQEPIIEARRLHSVRRQKDELMVSLPRRFIRAAGIESGDRVAVAFGERSLVIQAKNTKK